MRPDIRQSLIAYASTGRPLGHFLTAVLENDLMEAFARADSDNVRDMQQIVSFVYNDLPSMCHGSPAKVEAYYEWIAEPLNQATVLHHYAARWSRNHCERCGGLGRIEDTLCEECEGRGYLLPPGPDTREEARGEK